jgi:four helix bundle protein
MGGSYRDLIVWQKSMDLVVEVYKLTDGFPKSELFGLTSQMRRASISIPSNIAEGSRRKTPKDKVHFWTLAFGSASELETQLEAAKRLSFGEPKACPPAERLLSEVLKMLNKMIGNSEHGY